jgi:methionyl-tRNA synthetase
VNQIGALIKYNSKPFPDPSLDPPLRRAGKTGGLDENFVKLIDNFKFDEALNWVFSEYVDKTNNYLNQETPWKLEKDDPKRKEILLNAVFNLRNAALNLRPIMPEISKRILEVFDGEIKPLEKPLFPRI